MKRQDLRRIIDVVEQKDGKYQAPGYPYKLGLLLPGQPGTGKTSLVSIECISKKFYFVRLCRLCILLLIMSDNALASATDQSLGSLHWQTPRQH